MLDVLNVSSGINSATQDKFPNEVLTRRFRSGFFSSLMAKDIKLFRESSKSVGQAGPIGGVVQQIWEDFAEQAPDHDFTEIYLHVQKTLGSH